MNKKQKIIFSVLFLLAIFSVAGLVLADTTGSVGIPNPLSGVNSIPALLGRVASFIQSLALALCLPFFVWGGVVLMTSGGDPKKVKDGRNIIVFTMVGIIVAFLANVMFEMVQQLFPVP